MSVPEGYELAGTGNWLTNFLSGDLYTNKANGSSFRDGGYGSAMGLGMDAFKGITSYLTNSKLADVAEGNLEELKSLNKFNVENQTVAMEQAANKASKYAGFFGGLNRGAQDRNSLTADLNAKYDDKKGVVNRATGEVSRLASAEAMLGSPNTPYSPANPALAGNIKKKTARDSSFAPNTQRIA